MESQLLELKKVVGSWMSGLKGLISQELSYHQESLVFVLSLGEGCFGGDLCCTSVVTVPLASLADFWVRFFKVVSSWGCSCLS